MGSWLQVFWQLQKHLPAGDTVALYAADSENYDRLLRMQPGLAAIPTLKEWEITRAARTHTADINRLEALQSQLGLTLWHALLADRRVFFGPLSKVRQDYRSRYTEDQMLGLLDLAAQCIGTFLEEQRPDAVLGFSMATFGDYLFERLAKQRGIAYGQLKSTKIDNNVALLDSGIEIAAVLRQAVANKQPAAAQVNKYVEEARAKGVRYEGGIKLSRQATAKKLIGAPKHLAAAAFHSFRRSRSSVHRSDSHLVPLIRAAWYNGVVHPVRTFQLANSLPLKGVDQIGELGRFAFYPMHFEPEVSLQVFGRPYQNQIELIRTLALSMPVGMKLVVKEHPRSLGFRKASYYRKLLDIPNVRLADPFMPSIEIVRRAQLVCVVSGTIGLEAAIHRKPVLVFGRTPYTLLPDTMVQQAGDLNNLERQVRDMLSEHRHDEEALKNYLSAMVSVSLPVNLYTGMLGKTGRHQGDHKPSDADAEYGRLADFVRSRLLEPVYRVSDVDLPFGKSAEKK